jgi:hypothetical protein
MHFLHSFSGVTRSLSHLGGSGYALSGVAAGNNIIPA